MMPADNRMERYGVFRASYGRFRAGNSRSRFSTRRVQQQILTRLVMRGVQKKTDTTVFTPGDVVDWFGVSANTARDWLEKWMEEGFIHPERAGAQRIRSYVLAPHWADILKSALIKAPVKTTCQR